MPRRNSGAGGFLAALAVAAVLAIAFVGFLYWHSQQGNEASSSPSPTETQVAKPAEPSPAAVSPIVPGAHPLDADERLPLGGSSAVRYTVASGTVTFQFDVAGNEWPSIDVDVNQNSAIDANLDRSYTIATSGSFCAQYIVTPTSWSDCGGADSGGRASLSGSRRTRLVTLAIPASELSSNPDTAHVAFKLCHQVSGGWQCSQSPGGSGVAVDFTELFSINLH
jgi:hypothetical protein